MPLSIDGDRNRDVHGRSNDFYLSSLNVEGGRESAPCGAALVVCRGRQGPRRR
jgi:hypothetical protein